VDRWKETATSIDEVSRRYAHESTHASTHASDTHLPPTAPPPPTRQDLAFLVRIKVTTWTRPLRRWCRQRCSGGGGGGGGGAGGRASGAVAPNPMSSGPTSPTNGNTTPPRERRASSMGSQTDRELLAEMDRDLDVYRRTSNFYKAMHRLTHSAKVYKNVDLFGYLKKLYENEPDSDKLFVGERPAPPPPTRRQRVPPHPLLPLRPRATAPPQALTSCATWPSGTRAPPTCTPRTAAWRTTW
jgi:hypothetical protein